MLVCCVALVIVGYFLDLQKKPEFTTADVNREPYVEISEQDREISLVSQVVEEWTEWKISAAELEDRYPETEAVYSARPVVITWGIFDIPDGSFIHKQHFEIAMDESFQDAQRYDLRAGERSVELRDLLVDTQYFFRITVELENNDGCSLTESFQTKWSPRIVDIDHIHNVRDIGGWKTVAGKTVRQGLLYRGGELDGASGSGSQLTEGGGQTMRSDLKIKTELDLRAANLEGVRDLLGQEVNYRSVPSPAYADVFSASGKSQMKEVFEVLAQEASYPVYLHCDYGADRTGVVCYILEALLGMSEEDCYREWELSVLANGDGNYVAMDQFMETFRELEGQTLQNKAENYLLSAGITQEQIHSIRNILVR